MNIKGKGIVSKKETPKINAPKRAKDEEGKFLGDDELTPDINEAWDTGVAPKKIQYPKKSKKSKSYKSK